MRKITLLFLIVFVALTLGLNAQVYVNLNATGANNGTSWANAYTDLGEALVATSTGEIWVAQGSYNPSKDINGFIPASNQQKTFKIPTGVKVYGGFVGTETLVTQRNAANNTTILEGLFGNGDKSYHVVRFDGASNQTALDGFTIQNGLANGTSDLLGAGIFLLNNSAPIIRNCIIKNNTAQQHGGAAYCQTGSPQFISCHFTDNSTVLYDGGALYFNASTQVQIIGCLFDHNTAVRYGGALAVIFSTVNVTNCTFADNSRGSAGKAIVISNSGGQPTSVATIRNSIFYRNLPLTSNDDVYLTTGTASVSVVARNNMTTLGTANFTAGSSLLNILAANPEFVDADNRNYQITCSEAVDAGDTTGLMAILPTTDLAGQARIAKTAIDLGAYENDAPVGASASALTVCSGTYVRLYGSCDTGYTWTNGVVDGQPFLPTATTTYTVTGTMTGQTAQVTVNVVMVNDETLAGSSTVCLGDKAIVSITNSVVGVDYFLRDSTANDNVVAGPVAGTGGVLNFDTKAIYSPTTYNVYGALDAIVTPSANNALSFDGINDRVPTIFSLPTTSAFSVEAWIYPEKTVYSRILSSFSGSGALANHQFILDTYDAAANNGRSLRMAVGNTIYSVSNVLTLNAWNHVAAVFNFGVVSLYVDGVLVGTSTQGTTTTLLGNTSSQLAFGEDYNGGTASEYFKGKMNEIRVWNKALTTVDVIGNMNECMKGTETNLLAYYACREGSGGAAVDKVAAKNGTLNGATWTTGNFACNSTVAVADKGFALDFDGTDDKVITTVTMPTTSNFSIEAWIYPRSVNNDRIVSNFKGTGGADAGEFVLDTYSSTTGGNNGRGLRLNAAGNLVEATNVLTLNAWNHVAATFNNGTIVLFVNGFSVASGASTPTSLAASTQTITIGEDYIAGISEYFNGKMDEVRIWNKTLTQTDIMNNMNNCLLGNEADLLAYYNFEDGTGTTLSDRSLSGNGDGLLSNMDAATDWVEGKFTCSTICEQEMTQTITITPLTVDTGVVQTNNLLTSEETSSAYQWIDCNNNNAPIAGATNQSFMPTTSGDYAVVLTNGGCSDTSACFNIVVTGLENLEVQNHVAVYPNPTTGELTLDLFGEQQDVQVQVSNLMGQIILQKQYKTAQRIDMQLEGASGLYFINISSKKGLNKTIRIIKK